MTSSDNNRPGEVERVECSNCGFKFAVGETYRMDDDGFIGCLPCFPVSNLDKDKDRFMRGPCYRDDADFTQQEQPDVS